MIVNVKNIRSTRRPEVSLTRTVYVVIGSDTIVIDQGRKIMVISRTKQFAVFNVEIVFFTYSRGVTVFSFSHIAFRVFMTA